MSRWSAIVLALALTAPQAARSEVPEFNPNAFSVHGAETLGMGGFGVQLAYGIPNLELALSVGLFDMEGIAGFIAPAMDLTAHLKTTYFLSTEVGGKARIRLIKVKSEGARHAVALWVDGGYILEQTVSPEDTRTGEYNEYVSDPTNDTLILDGDGNRQGNNVKFLYEGEKKFAWPYWYLDTARVGFGLLYSIRGAGTSTYVEVGADHWMPPDMKILGDVEQGGGIGGETVQRGYMLERDPFWTGRLTAGIEFNLSINVNFFLAATVMYGQDPNQGSGVLQQKLSGGKVKTHSIGQEWDPFKGEMVDLKIPVVEQPGQDTMITAQAMAGILLFFN